MKIIDNFSSIKARSEVPILTRGRAQRSNTVSIAKQQQDCTSVASKSQKKRKRKDSDKDSFFSKTVTKKISSKKANFHIKKVNYSHTRTVNLIAKVPQGVSLRT